jgi:hypothetical protein
VRPNPSLERDLRRQGTWPARRCGPSSVPRAKCLPGYGPSAQTLGLMNPVRRLLTTVVAALGLPLRASAQSRTSPDEAGKQLRQMILGTKATDLGLTPTPAFPRVFGAIMAGRSEIKSQQSSHSLTVQLVCIQRRRSASLAARRMKLFAQQARGSLRLRNVTTMRQPSQSRIRTRLRIKLRSISCVMTVSAW